MNSDSLREHKKALHVHLHGASTPATNKAVAGLLQKLNQTETVFSGTDFTMIFKCNTHPLAIKTEDT